MKNFKLLFNLIILLGLIVQTGCKKYEDGPSLSLRTKKARLANAWRVEKAWVNGIDSTEVYKGIGLLIEKSGKFTISSNWGPVTGNWQFSTNKDQIVISWPFGGVVIWHILRLKEKELWILREFENEKVEIHFRE